MSREKLASIIICDVVDGVERPACFFFSSYFFLSLFCFVFVGREGCSKRSGRDAFREKGNPPASRRVSFQQSYRLLCSSRTVATCAWRWYIFFYSSLSPRRRREKERLHVFFPLFSSRLLLDGHATDVAAVALQLAALLQVRGQAREFVAVDVELLQQVQLSQLRGKRGELVVAQVPPPESIPSHSHSPPPFIRQT